jgi:hypothetical protein
MTDMKEWKLENMPLKSSNGTVRSKRCNIISFYCHVCDMWHTQERKDTYIIETEEETIMLCKEAYDFWHR